MKTIWFIYLLNYVFSCAVCQSFGTDMCNITFDPKNMAVLFRPWVSLYADYEYNETDLMPMIQTIATRFSTLDMPYVRIKDVVDGSALIHIPRTVARFNAIHQASDNNTSHNEHPALQLILRFRVYENGTSPEDKMSSFHLMKRNADEANSIFPGTVQNVALFAYKLTEQHVEQLNEQINYAKGVLENGTVPYKLGAMFDLKSCENISGWLRELIRPVIEPLDFVYFSLMPKKQDLRNGVNKSADNFIKKFNSCKSLVLQLFKPEIKVGFQTSWPDTLYGGRRNVSNLIWFWEEMNNFARSTDTPVIMFDAFDLPNFDSIVDATQGWWKLNENILDEYVFDEKCAESVPLDEEEEINSKIWNVGSFVAVLVVMLLLAGMLALYWKLRKTRNVNKVDETEIAEFFDGNAASPSEEDINGEIIINIDTFAYDKSFEVDPSAFTIDESMPLGSGEFGRVYMGKIQRNDLKVQTAVKIAKKTTALCLKSLMCEIKVLAYIGKHDNIVGLLGAYTAELRKGSLLLFLELCPAGSLLKYLRRYRDSKSSDDDSVGYVDLTDAHKGEKSNVIGLKILRQWCLEILNGMLYLTSMRLIHADLATRNVLLDRDRHAKICDFGLSRRLYDYASYKKSQTEPMPWRWMSPEALRRLEFNEKTDVWAFGVTAWEIYSFGDVPYPGLSWSIDFPGTLEGGLQLQRPENCPQDMYAKMLCCWTINPLSRPTFSQLTNEFDYSDVVGV